MNTVSDDTIVKVKNMADYRVGYTMKEENIRRIFEDGEIKQITAGELRKLNYKRGGHTMLTDYLCVMNKDLANEFGIDDDSFENEYNWDVARVDSVLKNEPLAVLQDALDFAPQGIIDLIKDRAIELKIDSMDKRQAISDALSIDLNGMIEIQKMKETELEGVAEKPKARRASKAKNTSGSEQPKQRRTANTEPTE